MDRAAAQQKAEEWKATYERLRRQAWQRYRKVVDDLGPYVWQRWAALGVFALLYFWRIAAVHGFYLITYALGIFLLNRVLLFLSPKIDPEEDQSLPLSNSLDEDFRPFIRALPEKTFWLQATAAFGAAFLATFVRFLNVPVFWPILLVYFISLTFATMKKQIEHMMKYKYLPWEYGKKKYVRQHEPKLFED